MLYSIWYRNIPFTSAGPAATYVRAQSARKGTTCMHIVMQSHNRRLIAIMLALASSGGSNRFFQEGGIWGEPAIRSNESGRANYIGPISFCFTPLTSSQFELGVRGRSEKWMRGVAP